MDLLDTTRGGGFVEFRIRADQVVELFNMVAELSGNEFTTVIITTAKDATINDSEVAGQRRVAQGQEFRSNVHRGGVTVFHPARKRKPSSRR